MNNLDSILKSRDITLPTKVRLVKAMFFSSGHVWMQELDCARERRAPAERLLWPWRASPSASQLLAFSPGKEQAAGVWET